MNINTAGPLSFGRLVLSFCLLLTLLSGCGGAPVNSGSSSGAGPLAISSVSPKNVPVGSSAVTIVVTGTGFTPTTVIQLSGAPIQTTYVSSTEIQATIPASQLQTGTILKLAVVNGTNIVAADTGNDVQVDNPEPTVSALAPSSVLVNSPVETITVAGTNFVSGITLTVNGSPRNTTYVSATQLTASLTSGDFLSAAPLLLNAVNPQPGGGASGTIALVVANPAPTVTSLSPSALNVGSAATVVNIVGTGFVAGTAVLVNGASRPATLVSATAMTVALTSGDLSSAGSLGITAVNPAPGGGVSSSSSIAIGNPVPGAITLTPASAIAGTGTAQIIVNGSSLVPATVVYVNGQPRTTTYVNATQLVASLTSADLATAGSLSIVATSPSPGGGSSVAASLPVNNPVPGTITVTPNLVTTGNTTETPITVTGANFVPSTVVQINGSSRATTFISSTQLLSSLTVADQATAGSLSVNVFTPTPGGGTSSAASIAINNSALGSISLSPSTVPVGKTTTTIISVTGTGMVPGTGIQVNGSARATTYVSANQVSFVLTVSDVSAAGKLNVTAVNPAPNYSISTVATLTVAAPTATPVIALLNSTSAIAGSPAFTLSATGTGFTSSCTLQWNSTALATSYSYGTIYNPSTGGYTTGDNLFATIPASLLTTAGSASITANCPTAVTPTSNALTFNVTNPPVPTLTSISVTAGPIATDTNLTVYGTGFSSASTASYNGQALTTTYANSTSLTAIIPASQLLFPGTGSVTVTTPAPGGGTSNALMYTAYVPIVNNSMVYNPTNGLLYVSVPSSAGPAYGNSVVSVDPQTGVIGTPIRVGAEPDKLAVTDDGKFLWVALDGAAAVRQVDLTAGTAGLQFGFGGNGGIYQSPATVTAMIALPGSDNSVVVSTNGEYSPAIGIYDNGVFRGTPSTTYNIDSAYSALQADGSRREIYAAVGSTYAVYTYSASGLTQKTTANNGTYTNYSPADLQITGSRAYTDVGKVYDSESGSLLGTFYQSGTIVAGGATTADTTLGTAFVLDSATQYGSINQIQIFNLSDFNPTSSSVIPISVAQTSSSLSTMIRWGTNGLAFRASDGIYSVHSNLVKDVSTSNADLGVAVTAPSSATTGTNTTYAATVTNNGPSAATNLTLHATLPVTGSVVSATPSTGSCSISDGVVCNLSGLASGANATVSIVVVQTAAGNGTVTAQVSGSENDPTAGNNQGSATVTVTGSPYSLVPSVASINPSAIQTGAPDTTITVTGANFVTGSTVNLDGTTLNTNFVSGTQLTATVPTAHLANMGWGAITVSNPAPGGGTSQKLPLTYFTVLTVGLNHILYEPFSGKLYASVGSGSGAVAGNSIAAITPAAATLGTPVYVGSQPTKMAISDDGNIMYVLLSGANSFVRFNLMTQQSEFSVTPTFTNYGTPTTGFRDVAVQTGSENTVAVDFGYTSGMGLFDIDPVAKTGTERGSGTGLYTGTSLHFYNPQSLYLFNSDTWDTLDLYSITGAGFSYSVPHTSSTLLHFSSFKLVGKIGYADAGGVADITTSPATQLGYYAPLIQYGANATVEPDTSLQRIFFLGNTAATSNSYGPPDGIVVYDQNTFLPTNTLPLNMLGIEGNTSFTGVDLIRWGQDGLAALTSSGHLYLLRGAAVVPQLMNQNSAAVVSSSSVTRVAQGSGNTLITLTGSNFVPGAAVMWNGSYRTTTIVDATHLTVAIPASDLAAVGTVSVVAVNPGAAPSSALTITIE
jgi:trimeric autotransporter adhesin